MTPKSRFRPIALYKCDSNRLDGNIYTFFDRFRTNLLAEHNLSYETNGQGIVQETFTPGQGIIFRNLTPGQGSFSDFPAASPRMFVGQVRPPRGPQRPNVKQV